MVTGEVEKGKVVLMQDFFVFTYTLYIYILYSEKSDKYYIGYTDDPNRQLIEHNTTERNTFTSKYRPWILKLYFPVSENRTDAVRVERFIKKEKIC